MPLLPEFRFTCLIAHVSRLVCVSIIFLTGASHASVQFNRDILPILSDKCFHCHGPDDNERKGELRLDTREGLFSKSDDGQVIVPGVPEKSALFRRLSTSDLDERMPPVEAKKELSASELSLIQQWIEAGAEWEGHWAFVPSEKGPVPPVLDGSWARNAIDYFVLSRLQTEGLRASNEAERRTLIRRVTFDLTGLPPTREEVEMFLSDERPNAYEHLVDRLLASPRYGERMALAWMDAARYGDSSVYHADGVRDMWPWRDWVIRAYNANMPFDRFTMEQLAGDLLPNATDQQRVATGFHRNHGTTDEGGAIDEEYRVEYVVDRVKTVASVWLGLTMECAQCHDHKYDPISQREYYSFYAFFNRSKDQGMQTRGGNAPPLVFLFSDEQKKEVAFLERERSRLDEERSAMQLQRAELDAWIAKERALLDGNPPALGGWHKVGPFKAVKAEEAFKTEFGPEKELDLGRSYGDQGWQAETNWPDAQVNMLKVPENSALYLFRTVTSPEERSATVSLGSDDGIRVWLNGKEILANNVLRGAAPDQESVTLPLMAGENKLLLKISNAAGISGFYFRLGNSSLPVEVASLVRADELSAEQQKQLEDYYSKNVWPEAVALARQIAEVEQKQKVIRDVTPTSMVLEEMDKPRATYVLARGHYASPMQDQEVHPGVPACLPALPKDAPPNRLGLARWLTMPEHPLTARVAVNRYWQMLFGQGIVSTVADFGARGAWPSHPELLDWLAADFVESNWNVKRMMKQMVMSGTYRQASRWTPILAERDPSNILLARAPRFRLQGEFVRDNALAVSGLLVETLGGPSTKPYQPEGIWREVALDGNLRYQQDTGAKVYRRSMYIYWKRSAPSPSMVAFDAPSREKCVIQRQRTNTPLQALVTMNDVQFVEAARVFAERILTHGGEGFADRLNYAFTLATARPADAVRNRALQRLYEGQLERFRASPKEAESLLEFGDYPVNPELNSAEHAAWTLVASAILNLDEVLTRE